MKSLAALFLLTSAIALAEESPRVIIAFQERATVESAEIRLKDIATVTTADKQLATRLQEFRVGPAPRNGVTRLVQRSGVMQALMAAEPSSGIFAEGALQTVVEAKASDYSRSHLIEAAREHLSQHLRRDYPMLSRIELAPVGDVADLRMPQGDITIVPRPLRGRVMAKRVCVWLDVNVDGKTYRSVPVWMNVHGYAPVLVARRPIAPREKLAVKDFEIRERDIVDIRGTVVRDGGEIAGQRARTYIAAGAVVKATDIEPHPPVLAEQEVDVRVAVGPVLIETKAVAEEEGHVGEYVRVRNPSSASIFMARVVGDKSVIVTER